jgi:hypothetical protein
VTQSRPGRPGIIVEPDLRGAFLGLQTSWRESALIQESTSIISTAAVVIGLVFAGIQARALVKQLSTGNTIAGATELRAVVQNVHFVTGVHEFDSTMRPSECLRDGLTPAFAKRGRPYRALPTSVSWTLILYAVLLGHSVG